MKVMSQIGYKNLNRKALTWCTSNAVWIACIVRYTITYSPVIPWSAVSILCTITRIDTFLISTS